MKICCKCEIEKDESQFGKSNKTSDGLRWECKQCRKDFYDKNRSKILDGRKNAYYKNHEENKRKLRENRIKYKETISKNRKIKRQENREEISKKRKIYYQNNPEVFKGIALRAKRKRKERERIEKELLAKTIITVEYPADYKICTKCKTLKNLEEYRFFNKGNKKISRSRCKECEKLEQEKYRIRNKDKILQKMKEKSQTPEFKERRRKYDNHRYKTNIQYNLKLRYSQRIRDTLKQHNAGKTCSTFEYLGCSWKFLDEHLKSQYREGMNIELFLNGEIDIDHYFPVEGFNLENEEEAKVCYHWTNLSPEWPKINNSKEDKMPDGRRARDFAHEYTLKDKKYQIYTHLDSKNLAHVSKNQNLLPPDFYEILNNATNLK